VVNNNRRELFLRLSLISEKKEKLPFFLCLEYQRGFFTTTTVQRKYVRWVGRRFFYVCILPPLFGKGQVLMCGAVIIIFDNLYQTHLQKIVN